MLASFGCRRLALAAADALVFSIANRCDAGTAAKRPWPSVETSKADHLELGQCDIGADAGRGRQVPRRVKLREHGVTRHPVDRHDYLEALERGGRRGVQH